MNKKILIILIAFFSVLICITPIMASEITYSVLDDIFNDNHFDIENLMIEKENYQHTDANGKVDKHVNYYLNFNVKSNSDSIGENTANITSFDEDNKTIESFEYGINTITSYRLKFSKAKKIDHVNILITDKNGNIVFNNTTDHIKKTESITKDKPVEKKTAPSSSATYWASEKSDKYHVPSCEWAGKISPYNKVVFHSKSEAANAGYQPCEVCNP